MGRNRIDPASARALSFVLAAGFAAAGCGGAPALRSIQDSGSISAHREEVGADGKTYVRHKILNRDEVRTVKNFAAENLKLTAPGDCPERRNCDARTVVRIKLTGALLTIVPDCDTAVLTNGATFSDCGRGKTEAFKRLDAVLFPPAAAEPKP